MHTRIATALTALLLLAPLAHAAFRDLLAAYINSTNSVVQVLTAIKTEADAKNQTAALANAVAAMKSAKAQVAANSNNAAEVEAAVRERTADLQKATAALYEETHRIKNNPDLKRALAPVIAKLAE